MGYYFEVIDFMPVYVNFRNDGENVYAINFDMRLIMKSWNSPFLNAVVHLSQNSFKLFQNSDPDNHEYPHEL